MTFRPHDLHNFFTITWWCHIVTCLKIHTSHSPTSTSARNFGLWVVGHLVEERVGFTQELHARLHGSQHSSQLALRWCAHLPLAKSAHLTGSELSSNAIPWGLCVLWDAVELGWGGVGSSLRFMLRTLLMLQMSWQVSCFCHMCITTWCYAGDAGATLLLSFPCWCQVDTTLMQRCWYSVATGMPRCLVHCLVGGGFPGVLAAESQLNCSI